MSKEEYIEYLEGKNNYCNCPQLTFLVEQGKKIKNLELICDDFNAELDLENPQKKDLDKLLDYRKKAKELNQSVESYSKTITSLINKRDLVLVLHDYDFPLETIQLSLSSLSRIPEDSIITTNCAHCEQQIESFCEDYL